TGIATQNLHTKNDNLTPSNFVIVDKDGNRVDFTNPPTAATALNSGFNIVPNALSPAPDSPLHNLATGNINLTQPILALRAWHAIGTTYVAERAAKLSVDDLKRNIALGVANSLVGVVTAERIAELNRIGFRSALERLALAQRRRALGAATGLDVVRAQQDVETARATLVTGDESLRQSREALGLALGVPVQMGVAPNINLDGLEADARRACKVAPSIDDRADIKV